MSTPASAQWINDTVAFPNCMVDRITVRTMAFYGALGQVTVHWGRLRCIGAGY